MFRAHTQIEGEHSTHKSWLSCCPRRRLRCQGRASRRGFCSISLRALRAALRCSPDSIAGKQQAFSGTPTLEAHLYRQMTAHLPPSSARGGPAACSQCVQAWPGLQCPSWPLLCGCCFVPANPRRAQPAVNMPRGMHVSLSIPLRRQALEYLNRCQDTPILHDDLLAMAVASPMQTLWLRRRGLHSMRRMKAQPLRVQQHGQALHALCDRCQQLPRVSWLATVRHGVQYA